ncbi:hypothetical protein M758_3G207900 [Ceratodon purpureus]|nr:hypothetical protein M758_3G207900 [Ceratodon purpureus]
MEVHVQGNGEVEGKLDGGDVGEGGVEGGEGAMGFERNLEEEVPSTSECVSEEELKGEGGGGFGEEAELTREESGTSSPRVERSEGVKEELKRENGTSSPRGERSEGRREERNAGEGLRAGGSKGKGSGGRGRGKGPGGVGKESGRNGKGESNRGRGGDGGSKGSETIRAAGLPSMRRTKSQPGRSRGGGEREEIAEEKKEEPVQEKEDVPQSSDRASGEVGANWASWVGCVKEWVEKQEPAILAVRDYLLQLRARVQSRVRQHWPLVRAWLLLITRVMLMLSLLGLEAAIRGFASLFRLGSAAHFLLLWCTVLSFIRLSGLFNLIIVLGLSAGAVFFVGYTPAFVLLALFGTAVLWLYGSFWTTGAVMIVGGALFAANQGRLAVFTTMSYAVYSMKSSGGWLGLLFCIALSFISSDLALYFLSSVEKDEKFTNSKADQTPFSHQKSFNGRSSDGSVPYTDSSQGNGDTARSSTGASTSGANEGDPLSAEEEVARVLGCNDHYAVLGFARYDTFDISSLKREYRKKAMLVHPDKNGGNDQAEEAFKRLQNAYEILLDAVKKKTYDEELRREDLLMTIRRHHVHGNGRNGTPDCGCRHSEDDGDEGLPANSRRISCRKCGKDHAWISTNKTKLRARWCMECQDHHPAKDGDGWVEQTGQAFFFGIFQKIDLPHAYACADGMVYEVTEWVLCQGLKCPPNTHKPTFHVNTSGIGKSPTRPARSSSKGAPGAPDGFPFADFDSNMTEEEFFVWLQNNMASANFSDLNGGAPFPGGAPKGSPAKPGSATKTRGKKKKGKKQW